jgi:hypothetical protein
MFCDGGSPVFDASDNTSTSLTFPTYKNTAPSQSQSRASSKRRVLRLTSLKSTGIASPCKPNMRCLFEKPAIGNALRPVHTLVAFGAGFSAPLAKTIWPST